MTHTELAYHWSQNEFLRASQAGVFDHRVELVEGEVWPVIIGSWHGKTVGRVVRALPGTGGEVTAETLPAGDSLPDPDCWVQRADAKPIRSLGSKMGVWDPADVLLVVEVSDETMLQDLQIKARLHGKAGYPVYWVVTREAIYEYTEPSAAGYRTRREFRPGERIPVAYARTDLAVVDLIAPAPE
jgi:Putative restriction endonuclease